MKKPIRYSAALLTAVLLVGAAISLGLYHWDNKYTAALPGGEGYNVLQDPERIAFLVDGWEYYPGQLLGPEDFASQDTSPLYTYIGQYSNFSAQLGSPYGQATYRLVLRNPGQPVEVAVYLQELLCAARIYINGQRVGEQGSVEPYEPRVIDGVYAFTAGESTEIIIQCANYSHYYSGLYYPPAIGTPGTVARMIAVRMMVYGFLCFASLAIALFNLIQWAYSKNRMARWMGLLCLMFALQVCYPFIRILGVPMVRLLYMLEDVCASVVLLCAIWMAGTLSGAAEKNFHRRVALPAAVAACVYSGLFPLVILPYAPQIINAYGILLSIWKMAAGVYLLLLAGLALRTDRYSGIYLLCAAGLNGLWLVVSVCTINRMEPIFGAWLQEYGGFALVVGYASMMMWQGVKLARENRRLTLQLQDEVDRKTRGMETLLAERRELLANLLHDLKNPLAALRGYAELVRNGGIAMDEETTAYLDALTERVKAVEERFGQLQSFSRGERRALNWEKICLNTLLEQYHASNCPDIELFGLKFELRLPEERVMIRGEREQIRVALENLCYNALSFTPPDGVIALELTRQEDVAVIAVRDTGAGIPPEVLPHVFERGFSMRAEGEGDGLGLYIVRLIALEHNGTVDVQSQPGKGSAFFLRLPVLAEGTVLDEKD